MANTFSARLHISIYIRVIYIYIYIHYTIYYFMRLSIEIAPLSVQIGTQDKEGGVAHKHLIIDTLCMRCCTRVCP